MSHDGRLAELEQELKERRESHRAACREVAAVRRAGAKAGAVCRVRQRALVAARRRRKARQTGLTVARRALERLRRLQRSTDGARQRVAAARRGLAAEVRAEAAARRELLVARRSRDSNGHAAASAAASRQRASDRTKVQALKLRQAKAAASARASAARRLLVLHGKHEAARRQLASKQRAARRYLEERLQAEASSFKRKAVEKAQDDAAKRRKRLSAYSTALRTGEPLHADKFHRGGASVVKAKSDDPDFSNRISVLKPQGRKHEYTLVYLHQFCMQGAGYVDWKPHYFYSSTKLPYLGLKVTLPTAKSMPITIQEGCMQYAWYDYKTDFEGQKEDVLFHRTLRETRDRIFKILDAEIARLGGDASRVFLGGASQGCCTALHCALQYPRILGGFVGIVGHLLSCSPLPDRKKRMPIFLYNGKQDRVMRWSWVSKTYRRFKDAGFENVHIRSEEGVTHVKPVRKEREWILEFLHQVIPDGSAKG